MTAIPAAHTPGPWTVDGPPWNQIVWSSAENRVCFLAHSNGLDDERDIATGCLIAAAPELLAIAEAALAFIDCHAADPDLTEEMVSKYNVLRLLEPHDVIAKAKGYPNPAREA